MKREIKTATINQYNTVFSEYGENGTIILAEYAGINVADMKVLRSKLTTNGAKMSVVKNRLAKIALEGTKCQELSEHFSGPVSMVYSKDPVGAAKVLMDFAKENEALKVTVGVMDGENVDKQQINALSKLPSIDELRAKLLGLLMAAPRDIASVINQMPLGLVRVIKAKSEKNQ